MIFTLIALTCLCAVELFYILDQNQFVKELEDEINELHKILNNEQD